MKRLLIVFAAILGLAIVVTAQESLGDVARRVKKEKAQASTGQAGKETAKPARVYTNADLPSGGGVSAVGTAREETKSAGTAAGARGKEQTRGVCEDNGGQWIPDPNATGGGHCRTQEEAYDAAAEKCRASGGTWKESRIGAREVMGSCLPAK